SGSVGSELVERYIEKVIGGHARMAVSKFRDAEAFPGYGTRRAGIVGLQDHGDTLQVRTVRIRTL
ncbi:MAG: hypothetical protein CMM84_00140, partial [Rhodothermaceae bacterium]|nr:hypothetical protein [Rhodothermaceae bacterium]